MRYTDKVKRSFRASVVLATGIACSGGNSLPTGPSPVTAEVEFRYVLAAGGQASSVASDPPCAGQVRLHPSFWGFAQVTLTPLDSSTWAARFEEVPVGRHSVRLTAPETCAGGDLFANGAPLSHGAAVAGFAVSTDGSVTP
jgi:hypothetical protein